MRSIRHHRTYSLSLPLPHTAPSSHIQPHHMPLSLLLLVLLLLFRETDETEERETTQETQDTQDTQPEPSTDALIKINQPAGLAKTGARRGIIRKLFGESVRPTALEADREREGEGDREGEEEEGRDRDREEASPPSFVIVTEAEAKTLTQKGEQVFSNRLRHSLKTLRTLDTSSTTPDDPYYTRQWYTRGRSPPSIDIERVWSSGITGSGVQVLVIDDSTDFTHPDLTPSQSKTYNKNYLTGTTDTSPTTPEQTHGTMVSGIIGSRGNNKTCGIGISPGVKLSCRVSIYNSATLYTLLNSFSNVQGVDIISNSWGFDNCDIDNKICLCISNAGLDTAFSSISRRGTGTVLLFSSGNDGLLDNDVNFSPVTRHPDVIVVGAVGDDGRAAMYETRGKSMFITGPSEGGKGDGAMLGVVAPTSVWMARERGIQHSCTAKMNGTSASCPVVAGVVALMKEANGEMTPCDVRLILAATANRITAESKSTDTQEIYLRNSSGFYHSRAYGFGYVSAGSAVDLSKGWLSCGHASITVSRSRSTTAQAGATAEMAFTIAEKNNLLINSVRVLLGVSTKNLLGLRLFLVSPSLERRELVAFEPSGDLVYQYQSSSEDTAFLTWEFWGEQSAGVWTVVADNTEGTEDVVLSDVRVEMIGQVAPILLGVVKGSTHNGNNTVVVPVRVTSSADAKALFGESMKGDVYLFSDDSPDPVLAASDVSLDLGDLVIQWQDTFNPVSPFPGLGVSNGIRAVVVPVGGVARTFVYCRSFLTPLTEINQSTPGQDGFDLGVGVGVLANPVTSLMLVLVLLVLGTIPKL